jgi:hypothetical protein
MVSYQEQKYSALESNYSIFAPESDANQLNYITLHFQRIEHFHGLKSLSYTTQKLLFAALIISLLVGTCFKSILYSYFWRSRRDKRKSFKNRPINAMILMGAIIHHVTHLFMGVNYGLVLGFDLHLGDYMGDFYCNLTLFIGVFTIAYLYIGSMNIAIFRVLYIKCGRWVKHHMNNVVLASIALVGSILLSLIMTILFVVERSSKRVIYNTCMGYSTTMIDIIYQYQGYTGGNCNHLLQWQHIL